MSDFLCIYELELLLTASPGGEIDTSSLFSSLADIVEVADGEDAFVAKSWLDAVVPIEDTPVSSAIDEVSQTHAPVSERSHRPQHHDEAEESEDGDGSGSGNVSAPVKSDQFDASSLPPVMQTILRKGQFPSLAQTGTGSEIERSGLTAPFTYSLTRPSYAHHPIHDFNVDMFLILGLIIDMKTQAQAPADKSSGLTLTLLSHASGLSRNDDSLHNSGSLPPTTKQQLSDRLHPDYQGMLRPLASANTITQNSTAAETLAHFASKGIGDRYFEVAPLRRDRSRPDQPAPSALNAGIKTASKVQSTSSATTITPNKTSHPSRTLSSNRLTQPSANLLQGQLLDTAASDTILSESGSRQVTAIAPAMATDESIMMAPMLSREAPEPIVSSNPAPSLPSPDNPSSRYGTLDKAASNLKKSLAGQVSTLTTLATEKNSILAGRRLAIAQYLTQQLPKNPSSTGSSPSATPNVPKDANTSSPDINRPESPPPDTSREWLRDGMLIVLDTDIPPSFDLPPRPDVVPIVEDNQPQEPTPAYEPITPEVNQDSPEDNEDTTITAGTVSLDSQSKDDYIHERYLYLNAWGIEGWGTEIWGGSHTFNGDNYLGLIVVHAGINTFEINEDTAFVLLNGGFNTVHGNQGDNWFALDGGENIIHDANGQDIFEVYEGINQIKGGNGGDWFVLDGGNNLVDGENGQDKVVISAGHNTVDGGNGHDWIVLDGGNNTVNGHNGNDSILIRGGNNIVNGGNGRDLFHLYGGQNAVNTGSGNDIIVADYGFGLKIDTPWILAGGNGKDTFVIAHDSIFEHDSKLHDELDHVVITDFEEEQDTIELYEWSDLITFEDLSLHQVGVNTHIMVEDELWAVVENVDKRNLHLTEEWHTDPVEDEIDVLISIRWKTQLPSQSLGSNTRSHSSIMDNAWIDWPYPTPYELTTPSYLQHT